MKKRALLLSSFSVLLSVLSYGQQAIATTKTEKETTKSRGLIHTESQIPSKLSQQAPNTIESIDLELTALENVLIANKEDRNFDHEAVKRRILELNEIKKTVNH